MINFSHLKACFILFLILVALQANGKEKEPYQVGVNAHYYFFANIEYDKYLIGWFGEIHNRVGLELELGKHLAFGFDRYFINAKWQWLPKQNSAFNLYTVHYRFKIPGFDRFEFRFNSGICQTFIIPSVFNFRYDLTKLITYFGFGTEVNWYMTKRWELSVQCLPLWHKFGALAVGFIGVKRKLFMRVDPDR
ncbi:hypothetical protein GC194_05325 [bacterium]|nr:hypothetical protein [bacterium]